MSALKSGTFLVQCDDALRELTAKVQQKQVKGKLTITLEIVPNGQGVGDVPLLKVVPDCTITAPKEKAKGETFFADDDNNLTRRHPGQGEMKLTLVSDQSKPAPTLSTPAAQHAAAK
jgi:hypothetical protein